jgi:large subunit ribosomal protein L35
MPKIKSHSGAKKRFFVTKKGNVKFKPSGQRHLLTGMSPKRGRHLRKFRVLVPVEAKLIKKLMPYA